MTGRPVSRTTCCAPVSGVVVIEPVFSPPKSKKINGIDLDETDPKQVISSCSRLIDEDTLTPDDLSVAHNKRANAYSAVGDHDKAYSDYADALRKNPNYANAYFNRAVLSFKLERYDAALEDFTVAVSIDRNDAETYRGRGQVLERLERYREAAADYTRALQIDRNDPTTLYRRGRTLEAQGRKKGAIDDFVAALALDRDLDSARVALNRLKIRPTAETAGSRPGNREVRQVASGQPGARKLDPQQVIDASSQFEKKESRDRAEKALAYRKRGINRRRAGKHSLAIEDFNRSLALDEESAETLWQRAVTFRMLKQYDEAIDDYTRALAFDPDYADALSGRAWARYKSGHLETALVDVDRALELKPDQAIFHDTRGHIYEALNLITPAKAAFQKALALDPSLVTSEKALRRHQAKAACD